jgi:hypothetical protein
MTAKIDENIFYISVTFFYVFVVCAPFHTMFLREFIDK